MILNTKQDYLNYLVMNPQEGKKQLQLLLNSRFAWFNTQVLLTNDTSLIQDSTHRLIKNEDEYIYQEYIEDANSKLFKIGFTVSEIEELIDEG